ncbi:voltage-dependent anion channel-domain-containing protein [Melampsora americana]|nr:voltage-dependent anion channel-domain-containing protein [Melampsora americana]
MFLDQDVTAPRRAGRISTMIVPKKSALSKMIHGIHWQAYVRTASVYILLYNLKKHPAWLTKIEVGLFIINCLIFISATSLLGVQAFLYTKQFKRVLMDPNRNSFIPTFALNFATIIVGLINYAVPAGLTIEEVYVIFWIYVAMASLYLTCQFPNTIVSIAWAFPVFPLMFTGVVAINVLRIVPLTDHRAVTVVVVGLLGFGGGAFMSIFYLSIFLLRLMNTGFMAGHQANGAFVAVGPPVSHHRLFLSQERLPANKLISELAGEIWFAGGIFVGIMLTGTAFLLFILAVIPYWSRLHKHLDEILGCWATTFPNVGLILALKFLGETFNSPAFFAVQFALTMLIIIAYVAVFCLTGVAIYKGVIFSSNDKAIYVDSYDLENIKVIDYDTTRKDTHGK